AGAGGPGLPRAAAAAGDRRGATRPAEGVVARGGRAGGGHAGVPAAVVVLRRAHRDQPGEDPRALGRLGAGGGAVGGPQGGARARGRVPRAAAAAPRRAAGGGSLG